jgi:hypothetical protein
MTMALQALSGLAPDEKGRSIIGGALELHVPQVRPLKRGPILLYFLSSFSPPL